MNNVNKNELISYHRLNSKSIIKVSDYLNSCLHLTYLQQLYTVIKLIFNLIFIPLRLCFFNFICVNSFIYSHLKDFDLLITILYMVIKWVVVIDLMFNCLWDHVNFKERIKINVLNSKLVSCITALKNCNDLNRF